MLKEFVLISFMKPGVRKTLNMKMLSSWLIHYKHLFIQGGPKKGIQLLKVGFRSKISHF